MRRYWLYISTAKVAPRSAEDALIYLQARSRNRAQGISGYLHRESGHYVQYVEGPGDRLEALKAVIRRDWRHGDIRVLGEGRLDALRFAGWDMAFTDEETSSFRRHQALRGGEPDIARAPAAEILAFMEETAARGMARPRRRGAR